jgi:hypothetical protein
MLQLLGWATKRGGGRLAEQGLVFDQPSSGISPAYALRQTQPLEPVSHISKMTVYGALLVFHALQGEKSALHPKPTLRARTMTEFHLFAAGRIRAPARGCPARFR